MSNCSRSVSVWNREHIFFIVCERGNYEVYYDQEHPDSFTIIQIKRTHVGEWNLDAGEQMKLLHSWWLVVNEEPNTRQISSEYELWMFEILCEGGSWAAETRLSSACRGFCVERVWCSHIHLSVTQEAVNTVNIYKPSSLICILIQQPLYISTKPGS